MIQSFEQPLYYMFLLYLTEAILPKGGFQHYGDREHKPPRSPTLVSPKDDRSITSPSQNPASTKLHLFADESKNCKGYPPLHLKGGFCYPPQGFCCPHSTGTPTPCPGCYPPPHPFFENHHFRPIMKNPYFAGEYTCIDLIYLDWMIGTASG